MFKAIFTSTPAKVALGALLPLFGSGVLAATCPPFVAALHHATAPKHIVPKRVAFHPIPHQRVLAKRIVRPDLAGPLPITAPCLTGPLESIALAPESFSEGGGGGVGPMSLSSPGLGVPRNRSPAPAPPPGVLPPPPGSISPPGLGPTPSGPITSAVPELAQWAQLVAGLGIVAVIVRRRPRVWQAAHRRPGRV